MRRRRFIKSVLTALLAPGALLGATTTARYWKIRFVGGNAKPVFVGQWSVAERVTGKWGGIKAYWIDELDESARARWYVTDADLRLIDVRLKRQAALVYATDATP